MIQLNDELRKAVGETKGGPVEVVDAKTNERYVLIRADIYERIAGLLDQQDVRDMQRHIGKVFGPEGWDEPEMDVYNEYDPRK